MTGITMVARSAITAWLAIKPQSPITRLPLTIVNLIDKPALSALIDHRLNFHDQELVNAARLQVPANPIFQTAADIENPNV